MDKPRVRVLLKTGDAQLYRMSLDTAKGRVEDNFMISGVMFLVARNIRGAIDAEFQRAYGRLMEAVNG